MSRILNARFLLLLPLVLLAPAGAHAAADDVMKQFAGDWVSMRFLCKTSREKRSSGTGVRIDLGTIEFENYEGEGIACTIRNTRTDGDNVVVTAMCRDEDAAPEERIFHFFRRSDGRLVISRHKKSSAASDAESFVQCAATRKVARNWLKRFCTVIDQSGTITDKEVCQVVTEPCGHASALAPNCLIVQWPSGARTLVETPDQSIAKGKMINGKTTTRPTIGWLPITGDCIKNSGSQNTLCLTIGPFERH